MEKFLIICEDAIVSRGTVIEKKISIYESFGKLGDAEYVMEQLYKMYKKEMTHQLYEGIKTLDYKGKHLVVTIDNGFFKPITSKLFYICKRMM